MTVVDEPPTETAPELPEPKRSLRDYLMEVDDIFHQVVTLPAIWGGFEVLIKSPTLLDRHRFIAWWQQEEDVIDDKGVSSAYRNAAMLVQCVCDPETEQPIWTYADIPFLVQRNPAATDALINACVRVMGMSSEGTDVGKGGSSPEET